MSKLPDFLIIGAQRAGTTWLAKALESHSKVWFPKLKPEPKVYLELGPCATVKALRREAEENASDAGYEKAPAGCITGDKTTRYISDPSAPKSVATVRSDTKVIVILRDPTDRAWSHWRYSKSEDREGLPFRTALALETVRKRHENAYINHGLYAWHLARWFRALPREQILVLRYEDLEECRWQFLGTAEGFLGLEAEDRDLPGTVNAAPECVEDIDIEAAELLDQLFEPHQKELDALLADVKNPAGPESDGAERKERGDS